jgi:UDP-glucose 4-epimerase
MKILVTGGAGFIGSHVAGAYVEQGHQVVVLDDLSSGKRENVSPGAKLVVGDVRDKNLVESLFKAEGFELVNHHAAQISVPASLDDPMFDAQVNLLGLLNLLEAGRKHDLRRFIFISSGGAVYGEMENPPVDENFPARPMSPYAVAKLSSEHYLDFYRTQYGLEVVTLRYANVYGPRQIPHGEAGVVAIFMDCLLKDKPPVIYRSDDMPGGMLRDYVCVLDCVAANLAALTKGEGQGPFNIGTGLGTTTLELWEMVQKAAGKELSHGFGPVRAGDIKKSALDCSRAAQILGFTPAYDLYNGLTETWQWRVGLEG